MVGRPRCDAWMRYARVRCALWSGHGGAHRTGYMPTGRAPIATAHPSLTPMYRPPEFARQATGGYSPPLLGPCPCQGCGEPLWWAKRNSRHLGLPVVKAAWREEDGILHRCPNIGAVAA